MAKTPFIHLRCRSAYSLLEGATPIGELKELCLKHEAPALALTDTNNLFGALEFSETLAGAGVQPIVGLTLKVRATEPPLGATHREPDGTLALLAQNEAGYQRLMALSSKAFLEVEPAEEPHVPLAEALAEPEGLLCLSGGPDGALNRFLLAGREDEARALFGALANAFGDRLYVELQRHDLVAEREVEARLVEEAYARGLPLVATNEPYFARPEQHQAHDALLCIAEGTYLSVDERRKVTPRHYFASQDEMAARFADLPEAIANTADAARRCAYRPLKRAPGRRRRRSTGIASSTRSRSSPRWAFPATS